MKADDFTLAKAHGIRIVKELLDQCVITGTNGSGHGKLKARGMGAGIGPLSRFNFTLLIPVLENLLSL